MGKIFFSKNFTKYFVQKILPNIFFPKKLIFHVWSFGAKAPLQVFFSVHRMMGHTQTNILRVFLKKNEIIKFFRKWKKRKSDLYFN